MTIPTNLKRALLRVARVFVVSAIGAMILIPVNYDHFSQYLLALAVGGISGGLAGLDKFIRDTWLTK